MADAEELVGYVNGNARRKQVIEALSKGGESLEKLEKLSHIPRIMLVKILEEMTEKTMVKKTEIGYALTPEGDRVVKLLKSMH